MLALLAFLTSGVSFTIIRIFVAIREDYMSGLSIGSTMISGTRTFKDDRPD